MDPKFLVFGSGYGVDEPNYINPLHTSNDAISLYQADELFLDAPETPNVDQYSVCDEDADHKILDDSSSTLHYSSLDPEAPVFVPSNQMEMNGLIRTEAEYILEALHPVESPPTPRIEVSAPNETSAFSIRRDSEAARNKSRSQSRQSSARGRSPSITCPRAQRKSRKTSAMPKDKATKLITALEDLPANRPGPYNVGDRTTPLTALHIRTSFPPPMPLHAQRYRGVAASVAGVMRPGYGCSQVGCPESERRWETKSERDHHERKHIPADQRAHGCEHCNRRFHYPKDVVRHSVVHNGKKDKTCSLCSSTFGRADNLKRHMKDRHGHTQSTGSANSPSTSSVTSFTQSPVDYTGPTTPSNLSPLAAKPTPWSRSAHQNYDSVNSPAVHETYSQPDSPLSSYPMFKSHSNQL